MKLDKNLREFIALLNLESIKYLIVGGYAVGFHGHPRFTGDIDFFIAMDAANATGVLRVISNFGFAGLGLKETDFLEPDSVIQLGFPPNRIDVLTGIEGVTFSDAWEARVAGELDGLPVQFIGRELLVRNKQAAGRPQDLADVDAIEKAARSQG